MRKPLEGIRVVELSTFVAAPVCGRLLRDLGAEVVKIEAAGQEWTITQFQAVADKPGQYTFDFSGLSARQMHEIVSVTVYQGDTAVSNTLQYSIETYAFNKQNEARIGDLVLAMMRYSDSAAAYLN